MKYFAFFSVFLLFLVSHAQEHQKINSKNIDPYAWDEWYLFTEDNNRVYINEVGKGDSVVVIHGGWGAEHSYLIPALKPLFDQYRFIFYDQRGSLRSPAADSTISLENFVADLEELRLNLGIEKMTLLSHSMGSYIAYAYKRKYPQHVKGVLFLSPVLPTGIEETEEKRVADKRFVAFAESNQEKELKENNLFEKPILTDKEESTKWRIAYASGNLFNVDLWNQMAGGQAFYNPEIARLMYQNTDEKIMGNLLKTLHLEEIPMFIIIGDHDLVDFGLTTWPKVVENFSHLKLLKLENAGHNAWIDQPEKFKNLVVKALEEIKMWN